MAMDRSSRPMHRGRKKVCSFCVDRIDRIDYKDLPRLRKYVSERSKIIPRRVTGTCAFHQRELTVAIKMACTAAERASYSASSCSVGLTTVLT